MKYEWARALKEQRKAMGITQMELTEATNIPQSSISAWENGTNAPSIENCLQLADFYGISLDELVGRSMK